MNHDHSAHTATIIIAALTGGAAAAQSPQMGGPMKHIMVGFDGVAIHAHVDEGIATPLLAHRGTGYAGNAAVLDGTMYNAQYGWMVEGFWSPPAGSSIRIEQTSASPGLACYSGGTMMNQGSFNPIFGTDGSQSAIAWDGRMLHNWYAVQTPGEYAATYRVYLADAAGAEVAGIDAATVTLNWLGMPDCAPDLAQPLGQLDMFDILAYFRLFAEGSSLAEFAEPQGVVDIFDALGFFAAYAAGC